MKTVQRKCLNVKKGKHYAILATIQMVKTLLYSVSFVYHLVVCNKKILFLFNVLCTATMSDQCANGNDAVLWAPQIFLFTAQFISGIGQPLYSTLGISYMDDNIQKSKTPAFVSK